MIQEYSLHTMHAPDDARLTGNGSAVDVGNAQAITIVAEINKGDAAAITLTPQRDDVDGGDWVVLANNMKIFAAADTGTADTLVRENDGVNYESGAVDTTHRVVLSIDPASLGLHANTDNPITQIRVVVSGGHTDDRGSITCFVTPRYKP